MATSNNTQFTESDGHELAIEMLRELRDTDCDDLVIGAENRDGRAQSNIVLRYLNALRERNSREIDSGFAAILTDFIGMSYDGGATDVELYEAVTNTR